MLNDAMAPFGTHPLDLYPEALRAEIDAVNVGHPTINNGVYRSGFATQQEAYASAVADVFAGLDRAEAILAEQPFLCGDVVTKPIGNMDDAHSFDMVYATTSNVPRAELRTIQICMRTRQLYQEPGITETTN